MTPLLLALTAVFFIGCLVEYAAPGAFNFEAVVWVGLILIIAWAVVGAHARRKVVGQSADRTSQLV